MPKFSDGEGFYLSEFVRIGRYTLPAAFRLMKSASLRRSRRLIGSGLKRETQRSCAAGIPKARARRSSSSSLQTSEPARPKQAAFQSFQALEIDQCDCMRLASNSPPFRYHGILMVNAAFAH